MLRMGIAGVGGLGTLHLRTLLGMADCVRVEALGDPIPERRAGSKLTSQTNLELKDNTPLSLENIRSYDDYRGICTDPELDVACIATPSDLHAPAAILALENGKHVFTEKPMALNPGDCRRMIDAAAANGKTLMVGQCLRFYPAYVAAKAIMESGRFGKPLAAVMNRYGRRPSGWFAQIERSGGVSLDLHIHDIDAALWWWGKPEAVRPATVGNPLQVQSVLSTWTYRGGPAVQIEASWDAGIGFDGEFRVMLESATLRYRKGQLEQFSASGREELLLEGPGGHAAEMHYFIRCLLDGVPVTRCPPEDSALAVTYALGGDGEP